MSRNRVPGRHVAALCNPGNHAAAFFHIAVIQQVKRSDLACPVAAGTVIENDRCYVLREGYLFGQGLLSPDFFSGRPFSWSSRWFTSKKTGAAAEQEAGQNERNGTSSDIHPGHLQYGFPGYSVNSLHTRLEIEQLNPDRVILTYNSTPFV